MRKTILIVVLGALGVFLTAPPVQAEVTFDLVTITDVGNPAYQADLPYYTDGRGSVDYEYQIGRFEITTEQYLPFVNLFVDDLLAIKPNYWGAVQQPGGTFALNTNVPNPGMLPCEGISWEEAAMYVNWLHNGQRSDLASTQSGVYDTSTFTFNNGRSSYNHVLEPAPGARYWIPSLDEWLKAAHYDPDRYGPGQGGWWEYVNSSDEPLTPGLPGEGDTLAYVDGQPWDLYDVPLGSYPHVTSPWGLLDLSGGTAEWTSDDYKGWRYNIVQNGSHAGWRDLDENPDHIEEFAGTSFPNSWSGGFRIASSVIPSPSALVVLLVAGGVLTQRRGSR